MKSMVRHIVLITSPIHNRPVEILSKIIMCVCQCSIGVGHAPRIKPRREAAQSCRHPSRGFSLLELLAVLTILGVVAMAAAGSFRADTVGDVGAQADARRLALDLLQTRRRAISTGDNHVVVFQAGSGGSVGYTVNHRLADNSLVAVDDYRTFPYNVTVVVSPSHPEFAFEGNALATCTITLTGPHRVWKVSVIQSTGAVKVEEL